MEVDATPQPRLGPGQRVVVGLVAALPAVLLVPTFFAWRALYARVAHELGPVLVVADGIALLVDGLGAFLLWRLLVKLNRRRAEGVGFGRSSSRC